MDNFLSPFIFDDKIGLQCSLILRLYGPIKLHLAEYILLYNVQYHIKRVFNHCRWGCWNFYKLTQSKLQWNTHSKKNGSRGSCGVNRSRVPYSVKHILCRVPDTHIFVLFNRLLANLPKKTCLGPHCGMDINGIKIINRWKNNCFLWKTMYIYSVTLAQLLFDQCLQISTVHH